MDYYQKYTKYKTKYLNIRKLFINNSIIMKGGYIDSTIIDSSKLGFGTDGIQEKIEIEMEYVSGESLIKTALKSGYIVLDTAYSYGNINLIANAINEFGRERVFVNYKVMMTPSDDSEKFIKEVEDGINSFKYIDCLMYHIIPTIDQLRKNILYIKKLCESSTIKSIGFSNLFPITDVFKHIFNILKEYNIDKYFKFVEEEFSISLQDERKKDIEQCKKMGIKIIGYSAFGGKGYGVCSFTTDSSIPHPHFNKFSHPKTWKIIDENKLDSGILNMAFLAYKYGVIQIPTSRRLERIKNNIEMFNYTYKLLSENENYVNIIYDETCKKKEDNEYGLDYPSRINLYNTLKDEDYGFKILNEFYKPYYDEVEKDDRRKFRLYKSILVPMIYLIEHAIPKYTEYQDTMEKMYTFLKGLKKDNFTEYKIILEKFGNIIREKFCKINISEDKINKINEVIDSYEIINKFKESYSVDNNYYKPGEEFMYVLFNKNSKNYVMPLTINKSLDYVIKDQKLPETTKVILPNMEFENDDIDQPISEWYKSYFLNTKELLILDTGQRSFWHNPDGSINRLIYEGPRYLNKK